MENNQTTDKEVFTSLLTVVTFAKNCSFFNKKK